MSIFHQWLQFFKRRSRSKENQREIRGRQINESGQNLAPDGYSKNKTITKKQQQQQTPHAEYVC